LLDAGLLDELHLFVHPATAGSGLRLFEESGPARHFELVSAQPFDTGVVYLVYAPDPNPPTGAYEEAKESLSQEASPSIVSGEVSPRRPAVRDRPGRRSGAGPRRRRASGARVRRSAG